MKVPLYTPSSFRWPMLIWMLAWSFAVISLFDHALQEKGHSYGSELLWLLAYGLNLRARDQGSHHLRGMYKSTIWPSSLIILTACVSALNVQGGKRASWAWAGPKRNDG